MGTCKAVEYQYVNQNPVINFRFKMTENAKTVSKTDSSDANLTLKDRIISEIKFFAGLIVFIIFFFTTVWGHYKIPSESMLPTLEVGDHVYVSKFAYGYSRHSLPFGLHHLPIADGKQIFSRLPKRGDVVVFRNPVSKIIMIKRLTGCLLYTSPSPRDQRGSRMPSSA